LPTIKDFKGYKIFMYFEDHNPPHFHVVGPDFKALVAIDDLRILEGSLPKKARAALDWAAKNKKELLARWTEYSE